MQFSQMIFVAGFLPLFLLLYFGKKELAWKNAVFFLASCFFLLFQGLLAVAFLCFFTLFVFFMGKALGKAAEEKKKTIFFLSLAGILLPLAFFQVQCSSTFPTENVEGLDALWHLLLQLPLYSLPLRLLSGKGGGTGDFFLFSFCLCLSGAFSGTDSSLFGNAGRNQKSCIFL